MLQKAELHTLRNYIEKRSTQFSEPAILVEILDHFACKVEEIREKKPGIGLDEAMKEAHASFGVRGFAPLADQAQNSLYQRYRKLAIREMKAVLQSYRILYLIVLGLASHRILLLLKPLLPQSGLFEILDLPLLLYILMLGIFRIADTRKLKNHQLHWATAQSCSPLAQAFSNPGMLFVYCVLAGLSGRYLGLTLYLLPVLIVFTVLSGIISLRLRRQAMADIAASRAFLADISTPNIQDAKSLAS